MNLAVCVDHYHSRKLKLAGETHLLLLKRIFILKTDFITVFPSSSSSFTSFLCLVSVTSPTLILRPVSTSLTAFLPLSPLRPSANRLPSTAPALPPPLPLLLPSFLSFLPSFFLLAVLLPTALHSLPFFSFSPLRSPPRLVALSPADIQHAIEEWKSGGGGGVEAARRSSLPSDKT